MQLEYSAVKEVESYNYLIKDETISSYTILDSQVLVTKGNLILLLATLVK